MPTFLLSVLLALLTLVDGAATLILLDAGCEEANPAMDLLIRRGPIAFLLGKYLLTVAGLPFLVLFRRFALFGTRLRIGHLLPIFVSLYLLLIAYQAALFTAPVDLPFDSIRGESREIQENAIKPVRARLEPSGGSEIGWRGPNHRPGTLGV